MIILIKKIVERNTVIFYGRPNLKFCQNPTIINIIVESDMCNHRRYRKYRKSIYL